MAAAVKTWSALATALTVPASTPTASTAVQISGGFGIAVSGTVTNPGPGLLNHGVAANLQISGDGIDYYTIDSFAVPATASATISFWFNKVPNDAGWVRLLYASNTAASVTTTAIIVYCTGYS